MAFRAASRSIPHPLVNEAITVTVLAGITGSASGGMSIALAAMSDTFIKAARKQQISRSIAPHCRDGERRHGHVAAQWRGHHAAGRHGPHSPAGKDVFVIALTKSHRGIFPDGNLLSGVGRSRACEDAGDHVSARL